MTRSRRPKRVRLEYISPPPPPPNGACNEWCAGMHLIERECTDHPDFDYYDVGDLMVAGAVRRAGHPLLYLYKHCWTRRYLNVDTDGVAWRFVPPQTDHADDRGSYERLDSPHEALDILDLRMLWKNDQIVNRAAT